MTTANIVAITLSSAYFILIFFKFLSVFCYIFNFAGFSFYLRALVTAYS